MYQIDEYIAPHAKDARCGEQVGVLGAPTWTVGACSQRFSTNTDLAHLYLCVPAFATAFATER